MGDSSNRDMVEPACNMVDIHDIENGRVVYPLIFALNVVEVLYYRINDRDNIRSGTGWFFNSFFCEK